MNYIISMPDNWKPQDCYTCPIKCQSVHGVNPECYLKNAKEAIEVKFDIDSETGLSVIDEKGVFHFEGHDKYYAVKGKP